MHHPAPGVIEWAPFRLADHASREQLLAASERIERDFLAGAEGYLGRVLLEQGDGRWTDLVFWRTPAAAAAAMDLAATSEACGAYFACMQGEEGAELGAGVRQLRVAARYGEVSF